MIVPLLALGTEYLTSEEERGNLMNQPGSLISPPVGTEILPVIPGPHIKLHLLRFTVKPEEQAVLQNGSSCPKNVNNNLILSFLV